MKITKKFLFAASLVMMCTYMQAFASTVEFTIGNTNFATEKDGVVSSNTLEAAPFINDSGRTMVPVRAISEAFGAKTDWDGTKREVLVSNGEKEIKLTIDNTTAYVNGQAITLDCAPVIVSNRTFVPLRFIGEAFSYNVNYAPTTRQVIIDDTPIVFTCGDEAFTLAEFKTLYDLFYQSSYDGAMSSGLTEEDLKDYILNNVYSTSYSIVKISNAFSDLNFTETDFAEIKAGIDMDSQYAKIQMSGLNTLVHEKYYFSMGYTIKNDILANSDIEGIYNKDYVCAKHILVEDEKTANSVYKKATSGKDFDTLVSEYGTDPGMVGNQQGYIFTKGEMVEEFEASAFALKPEEISKPVKTAYGYHIIKREVLPALTDEISSSIAGSIAEERLLNSPDPEEKLSIEELRNLI